jgi:NAD(P)-dependent dehydrogenase (short-subunit alcohol dehydrogenase family)
MVTGATRGLGRALVTELSRRDHQVVTTVRPLEDMADLPAAQRFVLDFTDPASINAAMATAGRLDVVINNAAMTVSGPRFASRNHSRASLLVGADVGGDGPTHGDPIPFASPRHVPGRLELHHTPCTRMAHSRE